MTARTGGEPEQPEISEVPEISLNPESAEDPDTPLSSNTPAPLESPEGGGTHEAAAAKPRDSAPRDSAPLDTAPLDTAPLDTAPRDAVALPSLHVGWEQELAPTVRDSVVVHHTLDRDRLCAELPGLWQAVDQALDRAGSGCLVPASVRHDAYEGWQVAALPRYDMDGKPVVREAAATAPVLRDRRALVRALVDAASERTSLDLHDALQLLDLFAGTFPLGLDAVCHRLLGHELRQGVAAALAPLHEALNRRAPDGVSAVGYLESAVGSRKAKGDPATDNEDAATAVRTPSGTLRLAVFDGVTGDGDGSGGVAARAALDQAVRWWELDEDHPPAQLVTGLDAAVGRATAEGSAAAVLASVAPDGTGEVVSVGDSEVWLVRPLRVPDLQQPYVAWRLTPAHTGYAEQLRRTADARGQESQLLSYLGGGTARRAHRVFAVAPGDLLVLASDGATEPERGRWFGTVLAELAAQLRNSGRPVAPALAAALVQRAEALGGWDNATALVCAVGEREDV